MELYKLLKGCVACNELHRSQQITIYSFGKQPLANNFHDNTKGLEIYPLQLNYCQHCSHLQLSHAINSDILFKNYLYVSGTTTTLNSFFQEFYDYTTTNISVGKVLDIGCNDGTQLNIFKQNGWEVLGVDPAINLDSITQQLNIPVLREFWGMKTAKKIDTKFDLIIAQNVFAHTANVSEFLEACAEVIAKDGSLYIQVSQVDMVMNNEFDTIYHEHISFFNIKSMLVLANRMGWSIVSIKKHSIHGNSYIFQLKKLDEVYFYDSVYEMYLDEEKNGLHDVSRADTQHLGTYQKYAEKIKTTLDNLTNTLETLSNDGFTIIGYGATAKSMTVLNALSKNYLSYFLEENKLKCGLYTPGYNIPIYHIDKLITEHKVAVLMTAWNYSEEIIKKLKFRSDINKNTLVIYYSPEVRAAPLYEYE